MYSLDVNFLKDRGLEATTETDTKTEKSSSPLGEKIPIMVGAIAALLLPTMAFAYSKSLPAKQAQVEQEVKQIEAEIADLQGQEKSLTEIEAKVKGATAETQALIGVFDKIRPWSAIIQEVGDRTPPGIQIDSLKQSGSGQNVNIEILGTARSYNDVNDFVLFLQRSPFFAEKKIVLGTVSNAPLSVELENQDEIPENVSITIPSGVKYTITAQLSNTPNSQLINELKNKGSLGLLTRLKTLETQGVIVK